MNFSENQLLGAKTLLEKGLHLTEDDTILVYYQDEYKDAAQCVEQMAINLKLNFNSLRFNKKEFYDSVPEHLFAVIPNQHATPKAIVLLMEWSEKTTGARLEFLNRLTGYSEKWRIASMPGVNIENFDLCICDLQEINSRSLDIFSILARCSKAIIKSKNPSGSYDKLSISIREYHPILSTGEISPGSWGNFPSGETFIVPDEFNASGWITIRGSFPNKAMNKNEWVRIKIRKGRMVGKTITASSLNLKNKFMKLFFNVSGMAKSENSDRLAELGIGTNDNIKYLTGNPIFDEKKAGTIHIAFGRNTQFGGTITSAAHHDITCKNVTVELNKLVVVDAGEITLKKEIATPNFMFFHPKNFKERDKFVRGNVSYKYEAHKESDGSLVKKLSIAYMSRNQEILFLVAMNDWAEKSKTILEKLEGRDMEFIDLVSGFQDMHIVKTILTAMISYNLIVKKN